jgi:hypothetical protein
MNSTTARITNAVRVVDVETPRAAAWALDPAKTRRDRLA